MNTQKIMIDTASVLLAACLLWPSTGMSDSHDDESTRTRDELSLALFKSGILKLNKTPSQISVGNPGIADILVLKGKQVHVLAKALGSTNVVFWDNKGNIFATVDIEVTHDLESLKQKLHILLPNEKIGVHSAQEQIILDGQVSSATNLSAAVSIAESYLPECIEATTTAAAAAGQAGTQKAQSLGKSTNKEGCKKAKVVNLMSVGGSQQVMLEVKIAEMSRSFMRSMDSDLNILDFSGSNEFGAVNGGASWPNYDPPGAADVVPLVSGGIANGSTSPVGPPVDLYNPSTPIINDTGLFFSGLTGSSFFQVAMEISRSKGLSKILAEPNLTTLTGKQAKFISGGEFPYEVRTEDGNSVFFKEFGVIVKFLPVILDESRISLDLNVEVSDLGEIVSQSGYRVIEKRGAASTVELSNGQTIGIAGLIQDDVRETYLKLPGLGDIPILGNLFRSQNYLSGQTELVIFVTAHLAKPISPDLIKLPTDSFVPPSDIEFYLMGNMASSKKPEKKSHRKIIDGGFDDVTFGHKL